MLAAPNLDELGGLHRPFDCELAFLYPQLDIKVAALLSERLSGGFNQLCGLFGVGSVGRKHFFYQDVLEWDHKLI